MPIKVLLTLQFAICLDSVDLELDSGYLTNICTPKRIFGRHSGGAHKMVHNPD